MRGARASVVASSARPDRYRIRVVGSDGGELGVSREDLRDIVARGRELLDQAEPEPSKP